MRIVSCVPSWTETLIWAGVNVVGRTRFCIHPSKEVMKLPTVGGTKDLKLGVLKSLRPDLVIMDREENTLEMANACPYPIFSSHIQSLQDLSSDLKKISTILNNDKLLSLSLRADRIIENKLSRAKELRVIEWWRRPEENLENYNLIYVIWRKPFMCVSQETYIGSVLSVLGFDTKIVSFANGDHKTKYPEFEFSNVPDKSIFLFSSEPYPFDIFKNEFLSINSKHPAALVDGELYSWFGIKNILFLESFI